MKRIIYTLFSLFISLFAYTKPTCNLHNGLLFSTYDISRSSWAYPYSHQQYDEMEQKFAKSEYRYGSGVVGNIDRVGSNNNPFQADPDERYMSIFEGYIYIPKDGEYSFAVNGDDAVEVIIDNEYVGWYGRHEADGTDHKKVFRLVKGYHKFKFRHQEWSGADSYQLYWKKPGDSGYTIVPKSNLFYCSTSSQVRSYRFDAIDLQRDLDDRNISTKIVGKRFSLKIIAIDESARKNREFNGTVCAKIVENSAKQRALTGWYKFFFRNANSAIWKDIEIKEAIKDAKVKITWKKGVDATCPLSSEDNATLSTDNFAIRPLKFILQLPPLAYAKDSFIFNAFAVDAQKHPAKNYNEVFKDSLHIEANETKRGCKRGTIDLKPFSFHNGVAKDIEATYSEIGDINITLYEKEGSEFAKVDEDDTNAMLRLIAPASQTITIKPYKIRVDTIKVKSATKKSWLYMVKDSDISEMNVSVGAKVKVLDKEDNTLDDFNESCYGEDVKVKFWYEVNKSKNSSTVSVKYVGTTSDAIAHLDDCNKSIVLPQSLFKNGEAYKEYAFDINSTFFHPLSPISLRLKKATIVQNTLAKVTQPKYADSNITFYYGYVRTHDLYTSKRDDSTKAQILVYDKTDSIYTRNWEEIIINWYLMEADNISQLGMSKVTEGFDYNSLSIGDLDIVLSPIHHGKFTITIANPKKYPNAFLHFTIPSWLWYSADKKANFSTTKDCAHHPCVHYRYFSEHSSNVKSGKVTGVGFEQNVSKHRRGVKLFR